MKKIDVIDKMQFNWIPVVCQSMIGVAYIQLTISNHCETGIGLAYYLRTSMISCLI